MVQVRVVGCRWRECEGDVPVLEAIRKGKPVAGMKFRCDCGAQAVVCRSREAGVMFEVRLEESWVAWVLQGLLGFNSK